MNVTGDLETVTVTHHGVLIATHVRVWARHLVVTDPAHVARAAEMRRHFRTQRVRRPDPEEAVQIRDLAAYDDVFGIDLGQDPAGLLEAASWAGHPRRLSTTPVRCAHLGTVTGSAA